MLVFHGEFSGEISSTDLKLLASQGFCQIDDIIKFKELFTRRDNWKIVPKAFQIMISSATNALTSRYFNQDDELQFSKWNEFY